MQNRRTTLKQSASWAGACALGALVPPVARADDKTAFEVKGINEALKELSLPTPFPSNDVKLISPDIAENGAVVPFTLSTTLPGVRRMLLVIEKNPNALTAIFNVSDAVEASFSIRAKMGQSSDVYAVAVTADGKTYSARREVKVTAGGCGG